MGWGPPAKPSAHGCFCGHLSQIHGVRQQSVFLPVIHSIPRRPLDICRSFYNPSNTIFLFHKGHSYLLREYWFLFVCFPPHGTGQNARKSA